jgi:hypothetical protein
LACRSGLPLLDAGEGGRLSVMQLDPERVAGMDYLFAEGNDTDEPLGPRDAAAGDLRPRPAAWAGLPARFGLASG